MTALAWAYLIHLDHQMPFAMEHDGMTAATGTTSHTPWSAADFLFTFVMWAVMMAGMMTPAAAPVLILFAVVRRGRAEPNASPATLSSDWATLRFGQVSAGSPHSLSGCSMKRPWYRQEWRRRVPIWRPRF